MTVESPIQYGPGNGQNVENLLEQARNVLMQTMRQRLDPALIPLLVIVLPEKPNPVLRQYVKWWSDVSAGIPTQCMQGGKKQAQGRPQYYENVALK